jgi:hypothetical protein
MKPLETGHLTPDEVIGCRDTRRTPPLIGGCGGRSSGLNGVDAAKADARSKATPEAAGPAPGSSALRFNVAGASRPDGRGRRHDDEVADPQARGALPASPLTGREPWTRRLSSDCAHLAAFFRPIGALSTQPRTREVAVERAGHGAWRGSPHRRRHGVAGRSREHASPRSRRVGCRHATAATMGASVLRAQRGRQRASAHSLAPRYLRLASDVVAPLQRRRRQQSQYGRSW